MRMSNTPVTRLEGIAAAPDVSGFVIIAGRRYPYRNGVFPFEGGVYVVSDDKDFVVSSKRVPIGAIIGETLVPMTKLTPTQRAFYQNKYGV